MKRALPSPCVYVVEDQPADRRALRDGLLAVGLKATDISEFASYELAWTAFEKALRAAERASDLLQTEAGLSNEQAPRPRSAKRSHVDQGEAIDVRARLPVAIVADVGLQHEIENGVALLGRAFRAVSDQLGTGLWTVAVTAHPLAKVPHERPYIPHMLLLKDGKREWTRLIGRIVGPLFADSLPTDTSDNDLSPSIACSPKDRIYIYERGNAAYANASSDGLQFDDCFDLGLIQPHLRELRDSACPVVMYRGRYFLLSKHGMAKVPRALLRARTVLSTRRRDSYLVELMSIDGNGNVDDSPGGEGIPASSVNNFFSWFRSELKPLIGQGLGLDPRTTVPSVIGHAEWRNASRAVFDVPSRGKGTVAIAEQWAKGPTVSCPADIASQDASLGLLSRLQFVLSQREVMNFRRWKTAWTANGRRFEQLYDAIS